MLADIQQHAIMHFGFLIGAAALLLRDQLQLRTALLVSVAFNIAYHAFSRTGPMWDDLFWNIVTLLTNLTVLLQLVLDRTHIGLSSEEERLFQAFGSLTPGEFRKLVKLASWRTASAPTVLTEENARPGCLFYVLEGSIRLEKAGRQTLLSGPVFIGEVAFVKNRSASATVSVESGTRYLTWATDDLTRFFAKQQRLRVAMMRLLSADMAAKVAMAQPI